MKITAAFDPITRIEGHLKIDVEIDRVGGAQQVVDVKSMGGLFRGFEKILIGRSPRDAQHITQRICGVCPIAHGVASVLAQDDAFSTVIPENARIIRNLINGANFVESHILHFFLLAALDFAEGPGMPPWQADWKVDRRLSKDVNDIVVGHYVDALVMRRKADQMTALFGGKVPHPNSFIPGGITCTPRAERIAAFREFLNGPTGAPEEGLIPFIQNVYLPDVELVANVYKDYFSIGKGYGNLLSYGVFDLNTDGSNKLLARGHVVNSSRTVDPLDTANIAEHVRFSWYQANPESNPDSGSSEPVDPATKPLAYSWLKAPRYDDAPHEVGPLARMWVNGDYQNGVSVMDRHAARGLEALKVAEAMLVWLDELEANIGGGDEEIYVEPTPATGVSGIGLTEAPRGALGHWLEIGSDGKIAHYQVISPTTWNCCPRDGKGAHGPLEEALLGTAIENADKPIEIMRVIHSFDPCLDCATHIIRPGKKAIVHRMGSC